MRVSVHFSLLLTAVFAGAVISCAPIAEITDDFVGDLTPPAIVGAAATSANVVRLEFTEPVEMDIDQIVFDPARTVISSSTVGNGLELVLEESLEPGREYWIDAVAEDSRGNTTSFLIRFYGINENLPGVLINEFTCEGSTTHPDVVELVMVEAGNLGGLTIYDGSPSVYDDVFTFPSVDVEADSYVVVHFKPQLIPEEINETTDPVASGGLDASETALDFWVPGGDGIPNTTGAITICPYPGGQPLDAVLYSTRSYDPTDDIRGYGLASQLEQAEELVRSGAWESAGDEVVPQDGFNPTDSTATRSICRSVPIVDTDSPTDWHIVPTGGSTFGSVNSNDEY